MVWNSHPLRKCNFLFKEQIKMLRIFLILYFFSFTNRFFSITKSSVSGFFVLKTYIFLHQEKKLTFLLICPVRLLGGGGLRVFHTFHLLFILFRINWNIKVLIQYILLQNCKISKSYLGCPPPPSVVCGHVCILT